MGWTGLTAKQLESMLFLTLAVALMIAATVVGGCAKGDLVPYSGAVSADPSRL